MLLVQEFETELASRGWIADSTHCWFHLDHAFETICSRPVDRPLGMALVSFVPMLYSVVISGLDAGTLFSHRVL